MGRGPCCSEEGLNRGAWTAIEDKILTDYIKVHGEGRWRNLPKKAGLKRCGKSCRLRWLNYLRPDIKRGNISNDEEELIIRLHKLLGNRWSLIAGRLPGRTDNEIKNYWNTNLGKKMNQDHKTLNHGTSDRTQRSSPSKIETNHGPPNTDLTEPNPPFGCTKVENTDDPGPSMVRDFSSNTLSSFATDEDMSLDLNMEDMYLSELLNSDLSAICDFKCENGNELSPSDQMLEGLTVEDEIQHNIGSDFNCLASFLESGGDWFTE